MNPLDYFLPYQLEWINDESTFKLSEKSRRVGITFATSYRCTRKCLQRAPGFLQWVSSRDELLAQEFIRDYVAKWCKAANIVARGMYGENVEVVDAKKGIKAFVVHFPNGNRIISLSSTPEVFAGKGGDILLDEVDLHKDSGRLVDMAMPCIQWGGQLEAISAYRVDGSIHTPFAKMIAEAKGENRMGASLHRCTFLDAVNQGLCEKINAVTGKTATREEFIRATRARCRTEAAWQSQYMCNPQDEGGALLPYGLIATCAVPDSTLAIEAAKPVEGARFYLGADIGRKHDLTCFWLLRLSGDVLWTQLVTVLVKTPFRDQLAEFGRLMTRYSVTRACIDATGIGAMLAEEAQRIHGHGRVEAITLNAKSKPEILLALIPAFQDRALRIPDDSETAADLNKTRKVVTAAGTIRLQAESDDEGHADRTVALALALHAKGNARPVTFLPRPFGARTPFERKALP